MPAAPLVLAVVGSFMLFFPVRVTPENAPEQACNAACQGWHDASATGSTPPPENIPSEQVKTADLAIVNPEPEAAQAAPRALPKQRRFPRRKLARLRPHLDRASPLTSLDILRIRTSPTVGATAFSPKAD